MICYNRSVLPLVLIADIVDSRGIADRARFQKDLGDLLEKVNRRSRGNLISPYTITIGDEFQAVYGNAESLFTDVMEVVSGLFPRRIRFALSCDAITTELNRRAAVGMDGPAFAGARAVLTDLKVQRRTVIRLELPRSPIAELLNLCLTLFANDLEKWKANAVSAFALLLRNLPPQELARKTGVHFTTAYRHIREKHFEDYRVMTGILARELQKEIDGGDA